MLEPSSMDHGPRTGFTEGVSLSAVDFIEGVGRMEWELTSQIAVLIDCLADRNGSQHFSRAVPSDLRHRFSKRKIEVSHLDH